MITMSFQTPSPFDFHPNIQDTTFQKTKQWTKLLFVHSAGSQLSPIILCSTNAAATPSMLYIISSSH